MKESRFFREATSAPGGDRQCRTPRLLAVVLSILTIGALTGACSSEAPSADVPTISVCSGAFHDLSAAAREGAAERIDASTEQTLLLCSTATDWNSQEAALMGKVEGVEIPKLSELCARVQFAETPVCRDLAHSSGVTE